MKLTTILFALFLLSALTSLLPSTTAVPDTNGDPLRNGGTYYIRPHIIPLVSLGMDYGGGGGIELATTGNEICPLTVVQSSDFFSTGLPIRISSPLKIAIIKEGMRLNLSVATAPSCSPTPEGSWTIVKDEPEGYWSVKIDGYEHTVTGWFSIQKHIIHSGFWPDVRSHKLVFCYSPTGINRVCADIGIYIDSDGNRRLVLTEKYPYLVQFEKATSFAAA